MKLPQSLDGAACDELVERWLIHPELARRLLELQARWGSRFNSSLRIISGYRTANEQTRLEDEGRPTAPDHLSTHRTCPATGADLQLPIAADDYAIAEFGRAVLESGLRWGGGSSVNERGIPSDWPHVDLGRRA